MTPIPLLVFHVPCAFGNAKSLVNLITKLIHFSKKSGRLSSTGFEILAFSSQCSANFQPILDCFFTKIKMKYDDLENIKTDCVFIFLSFFFGTPNIK